MPHLFLCDPRVIVEALLREIFPKSARNPQFSGGDRPKTSEGF